MFADVRTRSNKIICSLQTFPNKKLGPFQTKIFGLYCLYIFCGGIRKNLDRFALIDFAFFLTLINAKTDDFPWPNDPRANQQLSRTLLDALVSVDTHPLLQTLRTTRAIFPESLVSRFRPVLSIPTCRPCQYWSESFYPSPFFRYWSCNRWYRINSSIKSRFWAYLSSILTRVAAMILPLLILNKSWCIY